MARRQSSIQEGERRRDRRATQEVKLVKTASVFLPLSILKVSEVRGTPGIFLPLPMLESMSDDSIQNLKTPPRQQSVSRSLTQALLVEGQQSAGEERPQRLAAEQKEMWTSFTGMDRDQVRSCKRIIKPLACRIAEVSLERLDFLVVGTPKTTKKILFSLVFGIPLVTETFLSDSAKTGRWLDPLDYQSPLYTRVEARPDYAKLFGDVKIHVMAVDYGSDFSQYWLIYLLLECQCQVVDDPVSADIVISNRHLHPRRGRPTQGELAKVHFDWLLLSILQGRMVDNGKHIFFN